MICYCDAAGLKTQTRVLTLWSWPRPVSWLSRLKRRPWSLVNPWGSVRLLWLEESPEKTRASVSGWAVRWNIRSANQTSLLFFSANCIFIIFKHVTNLPFPPLTDCHRDSWTFDRCAGEPIPGPGPLHVRGPGRGRSYDRHGLRARRPEDSGIHPSDKSKTRHWRSRGPREDDHELWIRKTQIQTSVCSRQRLFKRVYEWVFVLSFWDVCEFLPCRRSCSRPRCLHLWRDWPAATSDAPRWCTSDLLANLTREWSRKSCSCRRVRRGETDTDSNLKLPFSLR